MGKRNRIKPTVSDFPCLSVQGTTVMKFPIAALLSGNISFPTPGSARQGRGPCLPRPVPRSTAGSTAETAGCRGPSGQGGWEGWDGGPVQELHAACVTQEDKAGGQRL